MLIVEPGMCVCILSTQCNMLGNPGHVCIGETIITYSQSPVVSMLATIRFDGGPDEVTMFLE